MSISVPTIKRLFALSKNQCAMSGCTAPLVIRGNVIAEISPIRARRKNGPRYDPDLSAKEKDAFENLVLLCGTHHTLIDKDVKSYPPAILAVMKADHERGVVGDMTAEDVRNALRILEHHISRTNSRSITRSPVSGEAFSSALYGSAAVSIGGNNQGNIRITVQRPRKGRDYPPNSIGADANFRGYIDDLCELYVKYMAPIEDERTSRGKLGRQIKNEFRIRGSRTRHHIPAEKFESVVRYLQHKLARTPVGSRHLRRRTKLCSTFEEWRAGRTRRDPIKSSTHPIVAD